MQIYEEKISIKGKDIKVPAIRVDNKVILIQGKFIKTARIKRELYEGVEDPEALIKALKDSKLKADVFTFCQRPPEIQPRYKYYMEWEAVSALPIKNFDHWWKKLIPTETRRNVKLAAKRGVVVKVVDFNDDLVQGISEILNETPVRRGKPFWHHGKDFETLKRELSLDLDKSCFIGAYYNDNLIGFIKLRCEEKFANTVMILSKMEYLNKRTNNALMAKAVETCHKNGIPYLTYGKWRKQGQRVFLKRNGFEKMLLPRYYIPLTGKGKVILKLKLHHEIKDMLPEKLMIRLLDLRTKWYAGRIPKSI